MWSCEDADMKMRLSRPSDQYATPRLTPFDRRMRIPSKGSKFQSISPVSALRARTCTWAVVMYMRPSTTLGVHSIFVAGRARLSPVAWIQATLSSETFERLIWSSSE